MHPYRYARLRRVWHLIPTPDATRALCGLSVEHAQERAVSVPEIQACAQCLQWQAVRKHADAAPPKSK